MNKTIVKDKKFLATLLIVLFILSCFVATLTFARGDDLTAWDYCKLGTISGVSGAEPVIKY